MANCDGCGADIEPHTSECPYCGHTISTTKSDDKTFGVVRGDGDTTPATHVRFGDGDIGRRPSSSGIRASYRSGEGIVSTVKKIEHLDQTLTRGQDSLERGKEKDAGVKMVEAFATLSDLISTYQKMISQEAHLSTKDNERLSAKEERIRPQVQSLIEICERLDSKTMKRMKISQTEIRRIHSTAKQFLELSSRRAGICSTCGAKNPSKKRTCQRCGAPM
ncbi:MAG: hypothetical protein BAJATHORv1_10555 [Candidatus Thorarchaeota archaeon]|nr:MAG: hypothetical protein BAJATHORv1_10555 [Candidatus Thorarchaeota archaeon]